VKQGAGAARVLTLSGGASWSKGVGGTHALRLDGTSGAAEADGPVIDTSRRFSVAAWVRVDSATGSRTAVSVDFRQVGGFFLQRRDDGRFAFTKLGSDSPRGRLVGGVERGGRVGRWFHLVAVLDRAAGTLTLCVNGVRR
jgi:Concanavalin A-like lectin/glucanases superfamily